MIPLVSRTSLILLLISVFNLVAGEESEVKRFFEDDDEKELKKIFWLIVACLVIGIIGCFAIIGVAFCVCFKCNQLPPHSSAPQSPVPKVWAIRPEAMDDLDRRFSKEVHELPDIAGKRGTTRSGRMGASSLLKRPIERNKRHFLEIHNLLVSIVQQLFLPLWTG